MPVTGDVTPARRGPAKARRRLTGCGQSGKEARGLARKHIGVGIWSMREHVQPGRSDRRPGVAGDLDGQAEGREADASGIGTHF